MADALHVLFVCTGNTCRSVMAEAFFRRIWEGEGLTALDASSAGLAAADGLRASREALALLHEEGLSMWDHRSRCVSETLLRPAHYIFTMTGAQRDFLKANYPSYAAKIWALAEFGGVTADIADPYGGGRQAYKAAASQIKRVLVHVAGRLAKIKGQGGNKLNGREGERQREGE